MRFRQSVALSRMRPVTLWTAWPSTLARSTSPTKYVRTLRSSLLRISGTALLKKESKMLESKIESYLGRQVKKNGGLSLKWISTITGVPDRIVILNRQIRFVELKSSTGKISPRQIIVFQQLAEQGFPVTLINSLEQVDDFIKQIRPTPVPDALRGPGQEHARDWPTATARTRQDYHDANDCGGALHGKDSCDSPEEGGGVCVGTRDAKVVSPKAFAHGLGTGIGRAKG